jgi:hypothetical protein
MTIRYVRAELTMSPSRCLTCIYWIDILNLAKRHLSQILRECQVHSYDCRDYLVVTVLSYWENIAAVWVY